MIPELINPATDLLFDELEARNITQAEAARAMGIPASRLTDIKKERKRISTDTALRLEKYLGVDADFWMRLQQRYELEKAGREGNPDIERIQPQREVAEAPV
jgi:addiction module HigA family antidote